MANIQAKKATRRGKIAHLTKIVNNIYILIENPSAIREVKSAILLLNEAFNCFVTRHEEYVAVLTDDIDIKLATDKLIEIENKVVSCKLKAEDYIAVQPKEISSQSQGSKEQKCLISTSAPSGIASSSKKSTDTSLKNRQEYQARKKLDGIKERQYYEKQLQDLRIETLKREMEIRRELELMEAERDVKIGSVTRLKTNKSSKSTGLLFEEENKHLNQVQTNKSQKSTGSLLKEEKNRLDQFNPVLRINMNTRDENTTATMTYEIPKRAKPFAFGEKIVPLDHLMAKNKIRLRFLQTFKAVVDNQPYDI